MKHANIRISIAAVTTAFLLITNMVSAEPNNDSIKILDVAHKMVKEGLKDPASAQFRGEYIVMFNPGKALGDPASKPSTVTVCGQVNAKNSYGGYTGYTKYMVSHTTIVNVTTLSLEAEDKYPGTVMGFAAGYELDCEGPLNNRDEFYYITTVGK